MKVCTCIVRFVRNVNAQVTEAENSYYIYQYKCNYSDEMPITMDLLMNILTRTEYAHNQDNEY